MIGSYQYFLTAKQTNVKLSKEDMTKKTKEGHSTKKVPSFCSFSLRKTDILFTVIKDTYAKRFVLIK